tara:strand:- start:2853 stop:7976 length:5124 start_codon:yes stop_codon:yes gene_type:complete
MLDNWREHDECSPWLEEGNYYIVVESEHQTPGDDTERSYRLGDAKLKGVNKLLQFYGKEVPESLNAITTASQVEDHFVSYKPCIPMKVLIRVPQSVFDQISDDVNACDITRPEDHYLEASISVYEYETQIDFVTNTIESYVPSLARSSRFISNINILAELKRLRAASNVIKRYLNRNKIRQIRPAFEACDPETDRRLIIGYNSEYKGIYTLIENEQHTIGYDCFVNNETINHLTTANYLINLDTMQEVLTRRNTNDFDIFAFLTRFTLPTPIIRNKEKQTDGLSLYADKGVSFGFADLAKIISLDLDINLCQSDEEVANENRFIFNPETRRNLLESTKQLTRFKGDFAASSENVQALRTKFKSAAFGGGVPYPVIENVNIRQAARFAETVERYQIAAGGMYVPQTSELWIDEEGTFFENKEDFVGSGPPGLAYATRIVVNQPYDPTAPPGTTGQINPIQSSENVILREQLNEYLGSQGESEEPLKRALKELYGDVLSKIDIACMVNDALQCYVDRTIALAGEAIVDGDEELGQLINTSISLGNMVNARCEFEKCNGSPDIDLSIGFPIFQGIQIPDNFPTFDFLAETIDIALTQLYAALVKALSSIVIRILQNSCEVLFDDALGEGTGAAAIKDGFQDWLGESIGVGFEDLNDPKAWGDALTSAGGTGFIGAVGNMVSRGISSGLAVYEDTGVALNLPNPEKGWKVEEVLVSPEAIYGFLDSLKVASEGVIAITTPPEQISLFQGTASDETLTVAYKCLKMRDPQFASFFRNKYEFADMFSAMGRMVKPEFLEYATASTKASPPDLCHIDDGTEARILRQSLLSEKEPTLSQDEMNAIIDKELEHNTDKIRKLHDLLQDIMNGSVGPSFPSLFGKSDSLIPELPPAMQKVAAVAIQGPLGYVMNSFNQEVASYSRIYESMYDDPDQAKSEAMGGHQNTPNIIFDDFTITAPSSGYVSDPDSSPRIAAGFIVGYEIDSGLINAYTSEIDEQSFGPYIFGKNPDVGGTPLNSTEPFGFIKSDGTLFAHSWNKNSDSGDHTAFMAMANDTGFGTTTPTVIRDVKYDKHDMLTQSEYQSYLTLGGNQWDGWDQNIGSLNPDQRWWVPMFWMHRINAYADNLKEGDDIVYTDFGLGDFNDMYVGMGDHHVTWGAEIWRDGPQIKAKISRTEIVAESGWLTALVRASGFTEKIVKFQLHRDNYDVIDYWEPTYSIASDFALLGRKVTGGQIDKTRLSTGAPVFKRDTLLDNMAMVPLPWSQPTLLRAIRQNFFGLLAPWSSSGAGNEVMGDILENIVRQFAGHIARSNYFTDMKRITVSDIDPDTDDYQSPYDDINLVYPHSDILGYEDFQAFGSDLSQKILALTLQAKSQQSVSIEGAPSTEGEAYCDTLTASRRAATIVSTMFLIRLYIVEQAMISIQVFDSFDTRFMDSDVFVSSVLSIMKRDLERYSVSFDLTTQAEYHSSLQNIISDSAVKYYEVQNITGASDVVFDPERPASALKALILEEVDRIRPQLTNGLNLSNQDSGASSWDEYLTNNIIGVESRPSSIQFRDRTTTGSLWMYPGLLFREDYTSINYFPNRLYSFSLEATHFAESPITLISVECEREGGTGQPTEAEEEAIYESLRQQMWQSPEYKDLFYSLLPLKDIIASLSLYEYAALSDPAVFDDTYEGVNLPDMFARTKIAILQSLASAVYGQGKIDYEDPFLKKAGIS